MSYYPGDEDDEEGIFRYCPHCECNVEARRVDNGFGYEYGSISAYHRVDDIECKECGSDDLKPERIEEEEEVCDE